MQLPSGVKAFFLLNASNLPDDLEKLARATTTELTYEKMREQIKKICCSSAESDGDSIAPPLKEECLYGYGRNQRRSRGGQVDREERRTRFDRDTRRGQDEWKSKDRKRTEDVSEERAAQGNPVNARGVTLRCFRCDSTKHFSRNCPQQDRKNDVQEIHITLFNGVPDMKQKNLVMEALGKGVLDCGCTKTVSGEIWIEEYLNTLSEEDRSAVKEGDSNATFRFGDGVECKGTRSLTVPVKIGKIRYMMSIEVVHADIPLLISKSAMKQMGMNLNFVTDIVTIHGEEIKLACTSSGHYCIPLHVFHVDGESCHITLHVRELQDLSRKEKRVKALKLHKQFGHASASKLVQLVKNSHIDD